MVAPVPHSWKVILHVDEDGVWCASVPALPGCVSDGKTRDLALQNVREAMELWLETAREMGQVIPVKDTIVEIATVNA